MKILFGSLLLSALFLVLGSQSARVYGCAGVTRKDKPLRIATESALIVWDEKSKTQHFIRRASFETQEPYFGFLVPTPTKPTLAETPDEVFQRLEEWTKPEVITATHYEPLIPIGCPSSERKGKKSSVEVVGEGSVANFNYKVVKATDTKALRGWLDEHGYDARPALMDWVAGYIKQGWYITAFQIAKKDSGRQEASLKAVRMSFTTDRPFFPYREPDDAPVREPQVEEKEKDSRWDNRSRRHGRLLRVFVVSGQRMQGKLGDGKAPWPGKAVWANPLQAEQQESMTMLLDRRQVPLNKGAWLTVFDDSSSPRPGSEDLFFSPADDQSTLQRPPIIHHQSRPGPGPGGLCCVFPIAVVIALLYGGSRRLLRWLIGA